LGNLSIVTVHLAGAEAASDSVKRLGDAVFGSSPIDFHLTHEAPSVELWPPSPDRTRSDFSYFSFSRLIRLYEEHGLAPRLQWDERFRQQARTIRHRFPGRLVCVHLRYVLPFDAEQSNADGAVWGAFLTEKARAGTTFLLLGDDPLPPGVTLGPGVSRAADLSIDLATQLALIAQADGFLGTASGLCTAANLSDVPHVIFKHPSHHTAEMAQELGARDSFVFAGPAQRLWRKTVTAERLAEALELILP
jgi:hypothetical protein